MVDCSKITIIELRKNKLFSHILQIEKWRLLGNKIENS